MNLRQQTTRDLIPDLQDQKWLCYLLNNTGSSIQVNLKVTKGKQNRRGEMPFCIAKSKQEQEIIMFGNVTMTSYVASKYFLVSFRWKTDPLEMYKFLGFTNKWHILNQLLMAKFLKIHIFEALNKNTRNWQVCQARKKHFFLYFPFHFCKLKTTKNKPLRKCYFTYLLIICTLNKIIYSESNTNEHCKLIFG